MAHDDNGKVSGFLTGLLCGLTIGAGLALVMAPESGPRTRRRLQRAAGDLKETAVDRWEELAEEVRGRVDEVLEGARSRLN